MQPKILLGMGCSVASTILTNLGILVQKHSADVEAGKPLWRRWRFWIGFTLNLGSEAGLTTVALALAPLSFIAPLAVRDAATKHPFFPSCSLPNNLRASFSRWCNRAWRSSSTP